MAAPAEHPYAPFIHAVEKPARYLGGEVGAVVKDWGAARAKVCLAFPDLYDVGMSHLGFKILYKILNDDPRTLAERCYAPWSDLERELVLRKLPLVSLESARPLREFDVVGFSLQFELTYTNVLLMLDLGGLPLLSRDRGEDDPLVLAGGPTATHPEPLADFVDAFVIGDGEDRARDLALLWTDLREKGVDRTDRLRALAARPGVYVPSLYGVAEEPATGLAVVVPPADGAAPFPVVRTLVPDLNDWPFPDDGPVGGPEAIFDRMSIEIARGCTEGCRFCQAGMIYRPVRERDPRSVVETVVSAVRRSGYDEASLTSLSTADYSAIAPLIREVAGRLTPEKVSLGVSSLRAYGLEESVLDDLGQVRATGVTFAPEAGSQRMRDVVNKNVTEEQLMTTAERVFSREWNSMKLYFMIGLPTEEESDVREIVAVGARAREVGRRIKKAKGHGPPTVTVSVSTHVPKPHTPFQWCAMDAHDTVLAKQSWLRDEARRAKVVLKTHEGNTSWLEGVFARGDRRLGPVLARAYANGARFDSWSERLRLDVWEEAFAHAGIDVRQYLGTIPVTARLPWDHIDVGLEEGFLLDEYRKALKSRLSLPCGKAAGMFIHHTNLDDAAPDARKLVCYDCGVACDLGAMREERLVYLRRLGAEHRREAEPRVERPLTPGKKKGPPPRVVQGDPIRYRFAYRKIGRASFLSHLDMIRVLSRAFRRLGIGMYHSSGYHPKPEMTYGPALSLGVSSLEEIVDMKLTAEIDPVAWLDRLSDTCPDGLSFTGGARLGPEDGSVSRAIRAARYAVAIPRSALGPIGGDAGLDALVDAFVRADSVRVRRTIEGIGKWVDARRLTRAVRAQDARAAAHVELAGFAGDLAAIGVDVDVLSSGSVKISEVVRAITQVLPSHGELPVRAVRVGLGTISADGELVSPLDLARTRAIHAAERAPAVDPQAEAVPSAPP